MGLLLRLAAALAFSASTLAAQTVELRLREDSASKPVAGAIVRLVGSNGTVTQGLSDEAGRLVLRAAAPGTYHVRIDRIGWLGRTTVPFKLDSGQVFRLTVPMPSERIQLPALEVWGRTSCDARQSHGELATVLWDEVRKALTANTITASEKLVPLHLRGFVREVTLGGSVSSEWVVASRIVRGPPFASLAPEVLAQKGFVYQVGDTTVFAAPDAALLLSDQFVATHCFYAVQGTGALAGLAFQPLAGRRVTDVTGTLWVDRQSSELRYLEFSYAGLPAVLRRRKLGGRLEFTRTPSGLWITSYWHVRMPRVEVQPFGRRQGEWRSAEVKGYSDRGGRAEVAGDTLGLLHRSILLGRVYDSLAAQGLSGAVVWVRGMPDSLVTNSGGWFGMATQTAGDQIVSVRHRRLGLLGVAAERHVLLSVGDTTRVEFGVPSLSTFVGALCRRRTRPGRVNLVGTVTRADGAPAREQEIRAVTRSSQANGRMVVVSRGRTTKSGLFGLCNLPGKETLQLIVGDRKATLVELSVQLQGESRWVELLAEPAPEAAENLFTTGSSQRAGRASMASNSTLSRRPQPGR